MSSISKPGDQATVNARDVRARPGSSLPARWAPLWSQMKAHSWHYLFIAPMLILYVGFTAWPIVASWIYAFHEWHGIGPLENYVGLRNFRQVARDPAFWNAYLHTWIFSAAAIFVQMPLALIVAVILNNQFLWGRNLYRVLLFLPVVTTTTVVGVVFSILLNPAGGPVNDVLLATGLMSRPVNFLGSRQIVLPTILGIDLWKGFGITLIYWLAGLQTIPVELYEAAAIDGASKPQMFRYITVPMLVPVGTIILFLTFINSFNAFDLVQTMTAGGPNGASDIVQTYIFRYAFDPESIPRFGFASAAAIFFGLTVFGITLIQAVAVRRARAARQGKHEL